MTNSLPRLYVPAPLDEKSEIVLGASQGHYLMNVLRLSLGSRLLLFNGAEGEWLAKIGKTGRNSCVVRPQERVRAQSKAQDLHYCFAPLKQARLDYMVQKAVELGVSVLQPVFTQHTVVARINLDRVRSNAIEAAEQCGILCLPEVRPAVKLAGLLANWDETRVLIFCDERAEVSSPLGVLSELAGERVGLLIGPEGGFSTEERDLLISRRFVRAISLGPRVMRADTAAVAALALINATVGDWRKSDSQD